MHNFELNADDEQFIDSLVAEALDVDTQDESIRFTHAFVEARMPDVLVAICKEIRSQPNFQTRIFSATSTLRDVKVYLNSSKAGTLLWMPQNLLGIASLVSRGLQTVVHWISVYESYTCRAYVSFDRGYCVEELLDPETYWTQNILNGNDLIGQGIRRFRDYEEFKASIKNFYTPKDERLDYERIEGLLRDRNLLNLVGDDEKFLRLDIVSGIPKLRFLGSWNKEEIRDTKTALGMPNRYPS
jgi:hypothetical protein